MFSTEELRLFSFQEENYKNQMFQTLVEDQNQNTFVLNCNKIHLALA